MTDRLIILAGGISSRMRRPGAPHLDPRLAHDADSKAKSMIGVGEKFRPFLDYLLYNARAAGMRDVVIVVGEADHSIHEYYGIKERGNAFHGMGIGYAIQKIPAGRTKPPGTADALLVGMESRPDWQGGRFVICNSDNLYSVRSLQLLAEADADCAMIDYDRAALEFSSERIERFAVSIVDREGRLLEVMEKPDTTALARFQGPGGRIGVSMNIFSFDYDRVLPYCRRVKPHPVRDEKEIPSVLMMMLADRPGSVMCYPLAEHVPDLTSREDIVNVQEYLNKHFSHFSWGGSQ
jgi:NDP-sugar pyrophosphorylase family protein